jgi:hypothetical protein
MPLDRAGNLFFADYEIVGGDLCGNGIESATNSRQVSQHDRLFVLLLAANFNRICLD